MIGPTRRRFLQGAGVATVAGSAGCFGDGAGGDGGDGVGGDNPSPVDDHGTIADWLTGTEVGGADETYDGTLHGRLDQDTVTIEVGATGNGGSFAFAPSAVVVSAGTEVRWVWTGDGDRHSVVADAETEAAGSDYTFDSGEAVAGADHVFTRTLETPGVALYYCGPHLDRGMKGGIDVE